MTSADHQRGMSESVQLALLLPLIFGVFLLLLQWGLISWAQATALGAAQESAAVAALRGAGEADGREAAGRAVENGSLTGVRVSVEKGSRLTHCVVTGRAVAVLFPYEVEARATAATERVSAP